MRRRSASPPCVRSSRPEAGGGESMRARLPLASRHVALRHRPALGRVGAKQPVAAPAGHDRIDLPGQVDGVADPGVHPEAAGRRHRVRRVAGDECRAVAERLGHLLAALPRHGREDLVVEAPADGALYGAADLGLVEDAAVGARADDRHPPRVASVDRNDRRPRPLGADEDETVARPLVVQGFEAAAAKDDVGGEGERRVSGHRRAERRAHRARCAVATDEELRFQLRAASAAGVEDLGDHAVGRSTQTLEACVVTQPHRLVRSREAAQDRVEHVLRAPLALLRALRRRHGRVHVGDRVAADLPAFGQAACDIDVVLRIVAVVGRGFDIADDPPAAAELHGARADQILPRLVDGAVGLLDQQAGPAAPAEIAGEREADRAAADDQNGAVAPVHRVGVQASVSHCGSDGLRACPRSRPGSPSIPRRAGTPGRRGSSGAARRSRPRTGT